MTTEEQVELLKRQVQQLQTSVDELYRELNNVRPKDPDDWSDVAYILSPKWIDK